MKDGENPVKRICRSNRKRNIFEKIPFSKSIKKSKQIAFSKLSKMFTDTN